MTDYSTWFPWVFLSVQAVFGVVGSVFAAIIISRISQGNATLGIIHTTVNSNLAAKQQEVASEQAVNADLRVQLAHANTVNAALVAAVTKPTKADK